MRDISKSPQDGHQKFSIYVFGPFRLDAGRRRLVKDGEVMTVAPKVLDTLLLLVENPGRVVSKEELLQQLWPETFVEEANLTQNVFTLRKLLGDSPDRPEYITTLPRRGYRFVARVELVSSAAEASALRQSSFWSAGLSIWIRHRWFVVAGGIVAIFVAGVVLVGRHPASQTIAVLPLANLTADASLDYIGDGLSASISDALSTFPDLQVLARSTGFRASARHESSKELARELRVDTIVTGQLTRAGDRLTCHVEVVDAEGRQLWGQQFTRSVSDVGGLERVVTDAVSMYMSGDRRQVRQPSRAPRTEEALVAYLKGRYFVGKTRIEEKRKSIRYFEEAIAHDPDYAPAHAALAKAYVSMYLLEAAATPEVAQQARTAALAALKLDPALAEAHDALAHVVLQIDENWPAAEREVQEALARNPNDVDVYDLFARGLRQRERFDESIAAARREVQLDPLSAIAHDNLAISLYQARQSSDETISEARAALELDPSDTLMEITLAAVYEMRGEHGEAVAARQRFERLQGRDDLASALGRDYPALGFRAAMRRYSLATLARLDSDETRGTYLPAEFAVAAVRVGQPDRAIEYLRRTIRAGHNPGIFAIAHDPLCESLKADARFGQLLNEQLEADRRASAR